MPQHGSFTVKIGGSYAALPAPVSLRTLLIRRTKVIVLMLCTMLPEGHAQNHHVILTIVLINDY